MGYLTKMLTWLNAEPGRKRAFASVAGVASVVLRHLHAAFTELCAKGFTVTCGWRLDEFSDLALRANLWIDGLTMASDATAFVFGVAGLFHAWQRGKAQQKSEAPR